MTVAGLESIAQSLTRIVAIIFDLAAMAIIIVAAIRTLRLYGSAFIQHRVESRIGEIRLSLGKPIILGLEFLIGADILRTSIAPTWSVLGQLAAIIVLRSFLNYTLEWELRHVDEVPGKSAGSGSSNTKGSGE